MSDLLKTGAQWLADQLLSNVSRPVEYKQADNDPVPLNATSGRTLFRVIEDGVSKVVWTDRDFIFKAESLLAAGVQEPQLGDTVIETNKIGNTTLQRVYLVSAPGGEQPYRNADGRDVMIRVHTKLRDEELLT